MNIPKKTLTLCGGSRHPYSNKIQTSNHHGIMKKNKTEKENAVKKDANVQTTETSHFRNGHKWLSTILGLTGAWVLITFILGLCNHQDLPMNLQYLNIWYLVNMAIIGLTACFAAIGILRKAPSQIFWSGTAMYLLVLQAISLVVLFFYQQDSAAINAIAMFVWAICWYGYLVLAPAIEADLPARHRSHHKLGEIFIVMMSISTIGYGIMVAISLL